MTLAVSTTVTEIVAAELGRPPESLRSDTDLRAVEGADSIKVLRMVAKIEQAYGIELEDDDIFGLTTIDQVVAVVGKAIAREQG
ncbi:acyl carrier protein [Amycolatopsis sp. K13G38]|uniref:Acyl carrier protein n=1 Tax=Amycolatopsis acididurans TaxID=2724524 RepID=A0ABX1JHG3_9PSEU|nr:acyl carrier protein [Amycolatopsis acididurans]NKQ58661.1 acyl carrier protein [Amycolatopsis acididurans]